MRLGNAGSIPTKVESMGKKRGVGGMSEGMGIHGKK